MIVIFFSTLGAAGGLFFRLNRPTAAVKRVYSTTHTRKHNLLLPASPEVAVSKAYAVITVSSLQAQKNVTAWAPEPPVPPFNQCSTAWRTLKLKMKALDSWPKIQTPYRFFLWELLKFSVSSQTVMQFGVLSIYYVQFYAIWLFYTSTGFPDGSDNKESACNAGDLSSIPEPVRFPGEENDNPLQ